MQLIARIFRPRLEQQRADPGGSWPRQSQLARLRFRLLQPEVHVHFAVHRRGSGEMFAGLLPTAGALIQLAKAEVTVGGDAPAR